VFPRLVSIGRPHFLALVCLAVSSSMNHDEILIKMLNVSSAVKIGKFLCDPGRFWGTLVP
jgi:hypothetical protein